MENCKNLNYAAIYSGGKDGHMALMLLLESGAKVSCLITVDGKDGHEQIYHDLRKIELLKAHSERMEIPICIVPASKRMLEQSASLSEMIEYTFYYAQRSFSFNALCIGTTNLDDKGQAWQFSAAAKKVGIKLKTPLADMTIFDILNLAESRKIKAIISAVEKGKLPERLLGLKCDLHFAAILDKLNKRGFKVSADDFQTLVIDSPLFKKGGIKIKESCHIKAKERTYLKINKFC